MLKSFHVPSRPPIRATNRALVAAVRLSGYLVAGHLILGIHFHSCCLDHHRLPHHHTRWRRWRWQGPLLQGVVDLLPFPGGLTWEAPAPHAAVPTEAIAICCDAKSLPDWHYTTHSRSPTTFLVHPTQTCCERCQCTWSKTIQSLAQDAASTAAHEELPAMAPLDRRVAVSRDSVRVPGTVPQVTNGAPSAESEATTCSTSTGKIAEIILEAAPQFLWHDHSSSKISVMTWIDVELPIDPRCRS